MNDMTQQIPLSLAGGALQSDLMTRELERLWLLSALKVGMDQLTNGQTFLADDTFFNDMEARLFGNREETVIDA